MKKLLALLLALSMVFALCACGGSGEPAADTADGVQHLSQRTQQQDETGGSQQQSQDQDGSTDEKIHTRTLAHTGEDFGVWNIDIHALTAFAE